MKQMTLYRKQGAYSYSPIQDDGAVASELVRLVPNEGKMLTNGTDTVSAIDIVAADAGLWTEVDAPPEPIDTDPESIINELEELV